MLLEDSAVAGMRISGGPVHSYPHPEGLGARTLSGSLPLPVQAPQRYRKENLLRVKQNEQKIIKMRDILRTGKRVISSN